MTVWNRDKKHYQLAQKTYLEALIMCANIGHYFIQAQFSISNNVNDTEQTIDDLERTVTSLKALFKEIGSVREIVYGQTDIMPKTNEQAMQLLTNSTGFLSELLHSQELGDGKRFNDWSCDRAERLIRDLETILKAISDGKLNNEPVIQYNQTL